MPVSRVLAHRKLIYAAAADRRRRFRPEQKSLRQVGNLTSVLAHAVIEARYIESGGKTAFHCSVGAVHAAGNLPCGVLIVTHVLKMAHYPEPRCEACSRISLPIDHIITDR